MDFPPLLATYLLVPGLLSSTRLHLSGTDEVRVGVEGTRLCLQGQWAKERNLRTPPGKRVRPGRGRGTPVVLRTRLSGLERQVGGLSAEGPSSRGGRDGVGSGETRTFNFFGPCLEGNAWSVGLVARRETESGG